MSEIVTGGQNAVPRRAAELGYEFRHTGLDDALDDVLAG
jgi:NAD dependent epimerase/dehydratase family enzyme